MPTVTTESVDIDSGYSLEYVSISGGREAPVVSVLGGIHGDEEEGVLAVRRLMNHLAGRADLHGTVRCVPIANVAAYRTRSRTSPVDGKDMARVFPGDPNGTLTDRAAFAITNNVIRGSDILIDLHSAGLNYSMPLFCGYFDIGDECSRTSHELGKAFGASLLWAHTRPTKGRTISAAMELGIPAIYAEAQGGGEVRATDVNTYIGGVLNVLAFKRMLDGEPSARGEQRFLRDSGGNIEVAPGAPASGVAVTYVSAGDEVENGELIAEIFDDQGRAIGEVKAPQDGLVMFLRRSARVEKGDVIVMLAERL